MQVNKISHHPQLFALNCLLPLKSIELLLCFVYASHFYENSVRYMYIYVRLNFCAKVL